QADHLHAERVRLLARGPADVAVTDDEQRAPGDLFDVELIPASGGLAPPHPREVLREEERARDHELGERLAVDAPRVREEDRALHERGEEQAVETRGARVHPADARGHREHGLEDAAPDRAGQEDVGGGSVRALLGARADHEPDAGRRPGQAPEAGVVRGGHDPDGDRVHGTETVPRVTLDSARGEMARSAPWGTTSIAARSS